MRILIVEDERKTAGFLQKGLREVGYVVDVAADGETGLDYALSSSYDLFILDVMLPRRDGWSILSELRGAKIDTPVLFLSARGGVPDRVKGLEMGADDYLVKPFAFSELRARVSSLLRRPPVREDEVLRVDDLEIDTRRHKASRAGQNLNLAPKEFLLLAHMARMKDEVVSRTNILEHVWDIRFDPHTNVVDVVVRRLRGKVDDPYKKKLIHTVRGVGYVLKPA